MVSTKRIAPHISRAWNKYWEVCSMSTSLLPKPCTKKDKNTRVISHPNIHKNSWPSRLGNETCGQRFVRSPWMLHSTCGQRTVRSPWMLYLGFQCLDHPPYSPDLFPLDYHLFPGLKKLLKGRHFSSRQPYEFFFEWRAKVITTGWEVYWASWGVCWINPEFCRCSSFPSWSG